MRNATSDTLNFTVKATGYLCLLQHTQSLNLQEEEEVTLDQVRTLATMFTKETNHSSLQSNELVLSILRNLRELTPVVNQTLERLLPTTLSLPVPVQLKQLSHLHLRPVRNG